MNFAIECNDLVKNYKKTTVLDKLSINVEENKIYGLLGRNGAGKTTLLNVISTQVLENSGEIKIFGERPYENQKVLNKICFIKERLWYMTNFKAKEIFKIASDMFENWDEEFKDELVREFELDINKKYKSLSKGMQSMVGIIMGLASRAPITIFDEAYSGLDAVARNKFYNILLQDYISNPRTIIFSTHYIDEVSDIFENIVIIHKGKLLLNENVVDIKERAFEIIGEGKVLDEILVDKRVLGNEIFGKMEKIFLFDSLSDDEIKDIKFSGGTIKPMSLQELFIHLTDK